MTNVFLASTAALAALGALFGGARALRTRGLLSAEGSRKLVHIGMGCVCMSFPWLFDGPLPVLVLAAIAMAGLLAVRAIPSLQANFGCVLHGVARRSYGEFAFIGGVATAFWLAHGDAFSYVIPVAVLTFADSLAAIVGTRFGAHRFATPDGTKSLEGSAAFLVAATACVAVPLALAGRPGALLVALVTAGALMLIEASAWAGLDNFAIPLVGGMLVRALAGASYGGSF